MGGVVPQGKKRPHRREAERHEVSRSLQQGSGMFEKGGGVCPFRDKPCSVTDVVLAQRKVAEFKGDPHSF